MHDAHTEESVANMVSITMRQALSLPHQDKHEHGLSQINIDTPSYCHFKFWELLSVTKAERQMC